MSAIPQDYTSLQAVVADYLHRADLTSRIPLFVGLLEHRLDRRLRIRAMERIAQAVTVAGQDTLALPAKRVDGDWDVFLDMRSLYLVTDPHTVLQYADPTTYHRRAQEVGMPEMYTVLGGQLYFAPIPDRAYPVTLEYYGEIPPLSQAQPTNDVLLTAPDVYLYGTLLESAPWTRASEIFETWQAAYNEAISDLLASEEMATYTGQLAMTPIRRI